MREPKRQPNVPPSTTPDQNPSHSIRGKCIAGYRVIAPIARGARGWLYRATDLRGHANVAIKVLAPELASREPELVARFLSQGRLAIDVRHPHLVTGIDAGTYRGLHYLVMEYIEGETLAERLQRGGPLSQREALRVCEQVADALRWLAGQGLCSRGIDAGRVLITRKGQAKLSGLWLSRSRRPESKILTAPRQLFGLPRKKGRLMDRVRAAAPCDASWFAMTGSRRSRLCGWCRQRVYNLADLEPAECEAFLQQHAEGQLSHVYRREDGTLMTRNCPLGRSAVRKRRVLVVAMLLLIAGGVMACVNRDRVGDYLESGVSSLADMVRP